MRKLVLLSILIVFCCLAKAQNYWSVSLPLLNYQIQDNIYHSNSVGIHYSEIKSHEAISVQFIKSNKWGAQLSFRTTNGERLQSGMDEIIGKSGVNFNTEYSRRVDRYENIRSFSHYSNFGYEQHFADIELLLFKSIAFKYVEFLFGGGIAKDLSGYNTNTQTAINFVRKDDKNHLYIIGYKMNRSQWSPSTMVGLELYQGKNFNLGVRAKLSYHHFNEQTVKMKRLSGLAPANNVVITEPSTYALYFGGQISFKYHLNFGAVKEGHNPLKDLRKAIFRY